MDVFAAARSLLDAIGAGGRLQPAWKPTHAFQLAWNASSMPLFSGEPKLKPDGIYGPLTTRALLHMVTLESQAASMPKPTDTGFETGYANPEAVSAVTVWRCFYDCTPGRKRTLVSCEPLFTGSYDAAELAEASARAELAPPSPGPKGYAIAVLEEGDRPADTGCPWDSRGNVRTSGYDLGAALRDVTTGATDATVEAVAALARQMLHNLYGAPPSMALDNVLAQLTYIAEHPGESDQAIAILRGAGPAEARIAASFDALARSPRTGLDFHIDLGNVTRDLEHAAHDVEHVLTHPGQDVHDVARQAAWDVEHPAHVASDVAHGVDEVRQVVRPVGDAYLSIAQSIVSLIPGIGTGVASALGAAQAVLDGGGPLDVAIRMAYGAIPIPPGLRQICDPIVDAVLALVDAAEHGKPLTDVVLQVVRDRLPAGLPRDVFDTLARVVAKKLTIQRDPAGMKEHMTASYGGPGEHAKAIARGIARHVPPAAARHLRKLPPSSTRYAGVKRPPPPPPKVPGAPSPPVTLKPADDGTTPPAAPSAQHHRPAPPAPPRLKPGAPTAPSSSSSSSTTPPPRRRPAPPPPPPRAPAPATTTTTDDTTPAS